MRVLIVEDELFIRMDLEQRVRKLGGEPVGSSARAQEAVELARTHRPDLILMDVKLKGEMNGIEAANTIAAELTCTIVFTSAFERQDLGGISDKKPGRFGYFPKPLSDATLRKILSEANRG
jgi:CheY-like chemotaxis protein